MTPKSRQNQLGFGSIKENMMQTTADNFKRVGSKNGTPRTNVFKFEELNTNRDYGKN